MSRAAVFGAFLGTLALTLPAAAQTQQRTPTSPPRLAAPVQPQQPAQQQAPAVVNNPFAALFGKVGETTALNPEQRAIIDKISNYLSSTQVLTGNFVQVGPDGKRTQGEFYVQKPGKIRFEYDPPTPIDIISDGQSVVVRDRNLATQDLYPLSQTPLRFLLADHINLLKDTNLIAVYADDVFVTAVIEERCSPLRLVVVRSAICAREPCQRTRSSGWASHASWRASCWLRRHRASSAFATAYGRQSRSSATSI